MRLKTENRILSMALVMLMVCTILVTPVFAAGSTDTQKKTVRVSCGMNNALYLNDNGKPEGCLSYFIQQLAYVNNWQLEYVEGSWNECIQNLYDGKIDILFPAQISDERKETMAFSRYIGGYQPIALYAKEDAKIYYEDYSA